MFAQYLKVKFGEMPISSEMYFKEFVLNTLDSLGIEKVKTTIGEIKITKSTSTIVDESKLGNNCFDYIPKRKTIKEIEALGYELEKQINRKITIK